MISHHFTVFERVIFDKTRAAGSTEFMPVRCTVSAPGNDVLVIKKLFTTGYEGVILLFCEWVQRYASCTVQRNTLRQVCPKYIGLLLVSVLCCQIEVSAMS